MLLMTLKQNLVSNSYRILLLSSDDKLLKFKFSIWARKEEGRKDLAGVDKEQSYGFWGEGSDCIVESTKLRTEELKPSPARWSNLLLRKRNIRGTFQL